MRKMAVAFLVLLLALAATACGSFQIQDGVVTIDFSISEATVNRIIDSAMRNSVDRGDDVLFDEVTGVDLIEPDIIRVFGTATVDGNPVQGSYDLRIGAESGALRLEVANVDVPGVTLDDPRLVQANAEMAAAFADQIEAERGRGVISRAEIRDGELQLLIEAPLE